LSIYSLIVFNHKRNKIDKIQINKNMKIVICASISFTHKVKEIADILLGYGHTVEIPSASQKILNGDISFEDWQAHKEKEGDMWFRQKVEEDLIKRYFRLIKDSDAILVVNIDKKEIKNYIGGNTFLEMGFAHVLDKKIFLLNEIPDVSYKDELLAMYPIIINGDLSLIK
jgi:nucleoside 2-deoxyribosyltransferase